MNAQRSTPSSRRRIPNFAQLRCVAPPVGAGKLEIGLKSSFENVFLSRVFLTCLTVVV